MEVSAVAVSGHGANPVGWARTKRRIANIAGVGVVGRRYCRYVRSDRQQMGSSIVYRIAEGSLSLLSEWQDQSINVLLPKATKVQGANLVIARERLPLGMSFQDYVIQQRQNFAAQLSGFELLADMASTIDGREAQLLEMQWRSDGKLIHQVMAMVRHQADAVLNFTGSIPGGPDDDTRQTLIAAITSFTFAQ